MNDLERKKILNLADTIIGEINRMCVTKELTELNDMALYARLNVGELRDLRFDADFREEGE